MGRASQLKHADTEPMSTQQMTAIVPSSIELGPISFNLHASDPRGNLVLFCRAGFEITKRHLAALGDSNRSFYVSTKDAARYLDYAYERLERFVRDPKVKVSDKAKVLHGVGKRIVHQLLEEPRSGQAIEKSGRYIENHIDLIMASPRVVNHLFALSSADSYTFSHSLNVCTLCLLMGEKIFGRKREDLWNIGMGGLLHDIGKTKVDQKILFKSSPLTDEEMAEMRKHSVFSYEILKEHSLPEPILLTGRSHHERCDGSGYPDGLACDSIHICARIAAIVDVYDAITSNRIYRKMRPHLDALTEMSSCIHQFDKKIFNALLDIVIHNDKLIQDFHHKLLTSDRLFQQFGEAATLTKLVNDGKIITAEKFGNGDHQ